MMWHFLYRTTCLITRRFYIGMHSTEDMGDPYLGSGLLLRKSIAAHGVDAHKREILEVCESRTALKLRERAVVTADLLQDPLCMNLKEGGEGGATRTGRKHSEETKRKIRASLFGHKLSESTRAKIALTSAGRGKGKPLSEEHKRKLSGPREAKRVGQRVRWSRENGTPDPNLTFYCDDARHLVCTPYTIANLHAMADQLGINRAWYHGSKSASYAHYDIPKRRIDEVKARCKVVTSRELLRIVKASQGVATD